MLNLKLILEKQARQVQRRLTVLWRVFRVTFFSEISFPLSKDKNNLPLFPLFHFGKSQISLFRENPPEPLILVGYANSNSKNVSIDWRFVRGLKLASTPLLGQTELENKFQNKIRQGRHFEKGRLQKTNWQRIFSLFFLTQKVKTLA